MNALRHECAADGWVPREDKEEYEQRTWPSPRSHLKAVCWFVDARNGPITLTGLEQDI